MADVLMKTQNPTYTGYIYRITNALNGMQYIGQTVKSVKVRWAEHQWYAKKSPNKDSVIFYRAINKYGANCFSVETVQTISNNDKNELRKALNKAECHYIKECNTIAPNGYNMTAGGYSPVIKNQVPVYCFSLDGELLKIYESIAQAEREIGIAHSVISRACNDGVDRRLSAGGFLWSKTSTPPSYEPQTHLANRKRVRQMTKDGETINEYDSITEAANCLGLQVSLISHCCSGKRKTTGGYRWSFI